MNTVLNRAVVHWPFVAPLLTPPANDEEYTALVVSLDELLDELEGNEDHALAGLAAWMGDLVSNYEQEHYPLPEAPPREVLRLLMEQHHLTQSELPEVGTQSVISEVLAGKRTLNVRQVARLAERFGVPTEVFIDPAPLD